MDLRRVKPSKNVERRDSGPRGRKESREIQRPDEPTELTIERLKKQLNEMEGAFLDDRRRKAGMARNPVNREEISRKLRRFKLPGRTMLGGR